MAKRCLGCMKMKNQSPVCEHCGFNENIPNFPHQLPLDTLLRGQYRVGKVLGQGGFGITYMGWDENLDVPIAIKEYFPNGFVNRECTHSLSVTCGDSNRQLFYHNRERFIREARALAKLRDVPGIVRIHNFFQENDTAYIVMEYVEGIDLKRYIRMRNRTLTASEALNILKPVMEALSHVHEAGLVHRDITPDNIMILPDGSAKLLDFGAVREVLDADADKQLSQATEAILKQGFAPMEQYQNKGSLGPWTDVYALCATMYYCITGRVPPDAPARLLDNKPLDWNLVPGLNQQQIAALERGMAILPKQRTASVAQLLNELYNGAQPAAQNYVNSAIQGNAMPNDFRNAYSTSAYSNSIPDPISNTGRNPGYPNHTVPLDANPLGGYQAAQSARPISGYQAPVTPIQPIPSVSYAPPVTKKKSKKGLIIGIAAACVAAVVAISGMSGGDSSSPSKPESGIRIQEPKVKLSNPSQDLESVIAEGVDYTYDYQNGSRLELYFDNNDLERCRLYYNDKGTLEYKFVAEYNEYGDILKHWAYKGQDSLLRQDIRTYDKDGNLLSIQKASSLGTILENREYTYDRGSLTKIVETDGQRNVKETRTYEYDSNGKETASRLDRSDGSFTEWTYNEWEKTKTQHTYDKKGQLERWYEYTYDSEGNRLGTITHKADGSVENTSQSVYNPEGNLIREEWFTPEGNLSYTMTYQYINGEISIGNRYETPSYVSDSETVTDITGTYVLDFDYAVSYYSDTPSHTNSITTYNELGNSLERISYNQDGTISNMSQYKYDAFGNDLGYTYTYYFSDRSYDVTEYDENHDAVGKNSYDAAGKMETWTEYVYDSRGLCVKETTYKANGSTDNVLEILYDSNNEPTKRSRTTYNDDGTRNVYVSDGDYNTLSSTTYDAAGNVKYSSTYQYEWTDFGEPAKAYVYDKNGKLSYWMEYFYDENGNYLDLETHFD